MALKNRYANRSKISEAKIRQIVKLFSLDLDASQITKITGLNRNTVNRYLAEIRTRIAQFCEQQSPFSGEVEVDESYFGARRIKGKRGRGAFGKTIVFGIFRRNGIESFWGYAKTRLSKFRGMNKKTFHLHLKECEFRFNNRGKNLYPLMLKIIRKNPLF